MASVSGAYSIGMKLSCDVPACEKRAVLRVFDVASSLQGQFCKRHGERLVAELDRGRK